jgi:hypothetical protein
VACAGANTKMAAIAHRVAFTNSSPSFAERNYTRANIRLNLGDMLNNHGLTIVDRPIM